MGVLLILTGLLILLPLIVLAVEWLAVRVLTGHKRRQKREYPAPGSQDGEPS